MHIAKRLFHRIAIVLVFVLLPVSGYAESQFGTLTLAFNNKTRDALSLGSMQSFHASVQIGSVPISPGQTSFFKITPKQGDYGFEIIIFSRDPNNPDSVTALDFIVQESADGNNIQVAKPVNDGYGELKATLSKSHWGPSDDRVLITISR